ncbi:MAG: 30S ribosomal protein S9 [Candidatus Korarchaeota archaeon]
MVKKELFAIGKKKNATARAIIETDTNAQGFINGGILINGVPIEKYSTPLARSVIVDPINYVKEEIPDLLSGIMIKIDTRGGGYMSQAIAARVALFKVLSNYVSKKKTFIKKAREYDSKIFISDTRKPAPKRYGGRGARARFQKSYR